MIKYCHHLNYCTDFLFRQNTPTDCRTDDGDVELLQPEGECGQGGHGQGGQVGLLVEQSHLM